MQPASYAPSLYQDLPPIGDQKADDANAHMYHNNMDLFSSKFGMMLPDPAPDPGIQLPDAAPEPDVQPSKHTIKIGDVSDQSPLNFHESVSVHFQRNRLIRAWKWAIQTSHARRSMPRKPGLDESLCSAACNERIACGRQNPSHHQPQHYPNKACPKSFARVLHFRILYQDHFIVELGVSLVRVCLFAMRSPQHNVKPMNKFDFLLCRSQYTETYTNHPIVCMYLL